MAEAGQSEGGAGAASANTQGQSDGATTTNTDNTATTENTNTNASGTQQNNPESGTQDNNNDFKIESLPQAAQDIIKNLRTENGKYRTERNNSNTSLETIKSQINSIFGGESDKGTPEEQLSAMQGQFESASYDNAVIGMAYESGIPKDNFEYFSFLVQKETNALSEGQELSDEALDSIVQKAKGFGGNNNANSSVNGTTTTNNDPQTQTGMTLDSFTSMSLTEKSELYRKSPEIYNTFMKQAREKKLL